MAVTNFNLDGFDDIVTANYSSQNVSILLGTAGGFQSPKTVAVSGNPIAVEPAAVRGAPDLAVAIQTGPNRVSILENAKLSALAFFPAPVIVGSAAHLVVHAEGYGALTYQWKKNGILLSDGGPISGSSTSTLTIDPVSFADATAVYDYVITDWCTSLEASYPALSVEFDDVPLDNPFHSDILRIATLGVTSGCTPTSFCPSNDVSRAEMAVFLLKSKYGADHVPPPPPPDPIFPDVPADAFAAALINEIATPEITTGCGGGLYCPDRSVSRAEMAVFLLKTLLGSGYLPPTPAGLFADVPLGSFAVDWIEDIYNRGITAGCGTNPLRYCPDSDVPREQMATFLVRTFGSEMKRFAAGFSSAVLFAARAAFGASAGVCPPTPFLQATHYALTPVSAVGAGDFNGDLKPDAVVLDDQGTELLLGDGQGGLGPPVTVAEIGGDTLTVADFNSDGKLDLAIARFGHVDVLLGNGDGTFTSTYSRDLTGGAVDFLLAVDVDGDHPRSPPGRRPISNGADWE